MPFYAVLVAVTVLLATTEAQSVIGHDQVRPFPQPEPVSAAQKAAVMFKPQLKIIDGCHPYPAVQKDGAVGGGLAWSGAQDGECKGSKLGSQIYARSRRFKKNVLAIVYAWYFPKGRAFWSPISFGMIGHRHNWEHIVLWINDFDVQSPDIDNLSIASVAVLGSLQYDIGPPKDKYLNGTSVKVKYYYNKFLGTTTIQLTKDSGEFQNLITWDQLSPLAQHSLSHVVWDTSTFYLAGIRMPLTDDEFHKILNATWPF